MNSAILDLSQNMYRRLFWIFLFAITLFRLFLSSSFGLGVDESHYVLYARHLAWGYFDHPPMVAFLVAATSVLGDGLFFYRLGPILCATVSLILLRYLALALYKDEKISFWAMMVLHLMPYQHLLMVAVLPDATLNLFWCGTLLAFWYALEKESWSAWIMTGFLFGGTLLSKYHAVLLPMCLFLYLATSPQRRYWLARVQPWLAVGVGFIIFLPNILWNLHNDWISYRYQIAHGGGGTFEFGKLLAVFGGQLAVWSPLIFAILIISYIILARQKPLQEADRFVFWTSLPVFVFFCGIGTFGKILPHWPSVGWWTGAIAVAVVSIQKISQNDKTGIRWRRWSLAAVATGVVMTAIMYIGLFVPFIEPLYSQASALSVKINRKLPAVKPLEPFRPEFDILNELFGWDQAGKQVAEIKAAMPHPGKTFIFGDRFFTTSQLGVWLQPDTTLATVRSRMDQYRLWFDPQEHEGWDALYIDENRYFTGPDRYLPLFESVDRKPVSFKVYRKGRVAHEIRVYRFYGFRGRFAE